MLMGRARHRPQGWIHTWGIAARRQNTDGFFHGKDKIVAALGAWPTNPNRNGKNRIAKFFEHRGAQRVRHTGWGLDAGHFRSGFMVFSGTVKWPAFFLCPLL
jgi:hypothetical protein